LQLPQLSFAGNAVRWPDGSDFEWCADAGGEIDGGAAFMYVTSTSASKPVRYTALNGGTIIAGAGLNRTYYGSNVVISAKNGGTFKSKGTTLNAAASDLSDSVIDVDDGKLGGPIPLGYNNRVTFSSSFGGASTVSYYGPYFPAYSENNTVAVTNASVSGMYVTLYGTNNTFVIDNGSVSTTHEVAFTSKSAPGTKIIFRGEVPVLASSWHASGVGSQVGRSDTLDGMPVLRFELPRDGFEVAPFQPSTVYNSYVYEYIPIEVNARKYKGSSKKKNPLIQFTSVKGTKPEAEVIESHLPAGALPEGAHLVWDGNTLCVTTPSNVGFAILLR